MLALFCPAIATVVTLCPAVEGIRTSASRPVGGGRRRFVETMMYRWHHGSSQIRCCLSWISETPKFVVVAMVSDAFHFLGTWVCVEVRTKYNASVSEIQAKPIRLYLSPLCFPSFPKGFLQGKKKKIDQREKKIERKKTRWRKGRGKNTNNNN